MLVNKQQSNGMALEDFFTLTEMKDGLATVTRVEELISVMQKQKDCLISNIVDAARQWSTVASILAATENKDCLNHFIQLNGLCSLNQWLQEAEKYCCGAADGSMEELINLLLGALQRLPLDKEKLISCRIAFTVKKVLELESPNIQLKARTLLDIWDLGKDEVVDHQDEEKQRKSYNDPTNDTSIVEGGQSNGPVPDESPNDSTTKMSNDAGSAEDSSHHINGDSCKRGSEADTIKNVVLSVSGQYILHNTSTLGDSTNCSGDFKTSLSSFVSHPSQGNVSIELDKSCGRPAGAITTSSTCNSLETNINDQPDFSQAIIASNGSRQMGVEKCRVDTIPCENNQKEACNIYLSSGLCSSPLHVQSSLKEPSDGEKVDSKEAESGPAENCKLQDNINAVDLALPRHCRTLGVFTGGRPEETDSFHKIEALGATHNNKETGGSYLLANKEEQSRRRCGSSKSLKRIHSTSESRRVKQKTRLDYGDDALELAVQVAIEAKREVADRERHSSSSDGCSDGEILESSSSMLEENEHDQQSFSKSSTKTDHSDDNSQPEISFKTSKNSEINLEQEQQLQKPSSVPEFKGNVEKSSKCIFDLNEDVCAEDTDYLPFLVSNHQNSLSAPVAVVAIPKGTPGLPATPLHFEGEMGWRGSAATSAFRPASPRRTSDGEKTVSGPKQKGNFLGIDLNIAEDDNDEAEDPILEKQIPFSCELPSGESSVEVTSTRADRLKLDLNRLGDENMFTNSSYWKLHHQNRNGSPSPASSSSAKQSSMRDIDLNDNPSFFDSNGPHNLNRCTIDIGSLHGETKLDDPVVTIMGSRMSMERKVPVGQNHLPFMANGLGMESSISTRSLVGYPQTLVGYGYNGLAMGPPLSVPSAMYGPGSYPYMVDSRGATVVPQIIGSSAAVNGPHSARPPFFVNVGGVHSGLGAVGGTRPSFDLNTTTISLDGGNKEMGGLRQFFMQGQSGSAEMQIRPGSQPGAGSGVGLKRKEPDCVWETYPIGYKQVTSRQ